MPHRLTSQRLATRLWAAPVRAEPRRLAPAGPVTRQRGTLNPRTQGHSFAGREAIAGGWSRGRWRLVVTQGREFKKLVRRRMCKTGESYTSARAHLLGVPSHTRPVAPQTAGRTGMYPFEKFTERAKKVLTLAQEEAERARHHYIGTEHLLLGLLRVDDGLAAKVLNNLGVGIDKVPPRMEAVLGGTERIIIQQIVPTSRVKKVIDIAFEQAGQMGNEFVGTEHLLLGLMIEGEGLAAQVLTVCGAKTPSSHQVALTAPRWPLGGVAYPPGDYLRLEAVLDSRLSCPLVLLASVYALARLLVAILLLRAQAEAERDLELLALRHEVAILRRQVKRAGLLRTDRLLLAALGRRLPVGRLLFTPANVLRWHRELVRRRWSAFGRRI